MWSLRTGHKGGGWGALFHRPCCGWCVLAGLCWCLFWEQMFHHICKHYIHTVHRELLWCYKSLLLTFPSSLYLSVSVLLNRHHTGSDFHHLCAIYTKGEGKSLLIQKAKTQLTSNSLETFAKNLYIKQVV